MEIKVEDLPTYVIVGERSYTIVTPYAEVMMTATADEPLTKEEAFAAIHKAVEILSRSREEVSSTPPTPPK